MSGSRTTTVSRCLGEAAEPRAAWEILTAARDHAASSLAVVLSSLGNVDSGRMAWFVDKDANPVVEREVVGDIGEPKACVE